VYGFTAATSQFNDVKESVKFLQRERGPIFAMIGGHFASWRPKDALEYFDTVVVGEAESVIIDTVENRRFGIIDAFESSKKQDVNKIPFPARHLLSRDKVTSGKISGGYRFQDGEESTTIISSRGCPHRCAFCANIPQKVRYRSTENFIAEVKHLISEYNCKNYKFIDDNFLVNDKHVRDICEELVKLNVVYRAAARSDVVTEEKCILLKKSGCTEIALGIETADDEVLRKVGKKETVETHKNAISLLKKHKIDLRAFMMVGLPGETKDTIEKTKRFIMETKPEKWIVSLFVPYPGSAIWETPEKFEVEIKEKNWDKFFQLYPAMPLYNTKHFTSEEITQYHKELIEFLQEVK
jgi:radical SAM superfamily enzyme YgiQ (UPF0313 family)